MVARTGYRMLDWSGMSHPSCWIPFEAELRRFFLGVPLLVRAAVVDILFEKIKKSNS